MPLYDFACDSCGVIEERLLKIDYDEQKCLKCDGPMRRWFGRNQPTYHRFREGWYEHIAEEPIYIRSKKQLKEECRQRGLTSIYAEEW